MRNSPEKGRIGADEAWDLIPWYVNGTLEAAEMDMVERRLAENPALRAEVASQRRLAGSVAALDTLDVEMERSLNAMHARIGAEAAPPETSGKGLAAALDRALALIAALDLRVLLPLGAATAAVALLLVVQLPATAPEGEFRTLTDPSIVSELPQLRIKVSGDATETGLRRLFLQHELRVVDGPSPTGVYTLETAPGGDAQAIAAALLAAPEVEFAAVRRAP